MTPCLLEIMDRATITAVEAFQPMGLDTTAAALVFAQSDALNERGRLDELEIMRRACADAGSAYVETTADPSEGDLLLAARRLAYPALESQGATLLDDVGVPRSRLPELLMRCEHIARTTEVNVATFGHAGDGNLHPTIVIPHNDLDARAQAQSAFDAIVATALELGGTVTGEHGVGNLKLLGLRAQLDPVNAELQRRIKRSFDPHDLLNPGRALA